MLEVPIFLFAGFLDSGKSTFIRDTLSDDEFANGQKTLLVLCEEGTEEFDGDALEKKNVFIERIDSEDELCTELLQKFQSEYKPRRVIIEYNGMWQVSKLMDMKLPKHWEIAQVLCTLDAQVFDMYISNMRSLVMDKVTYADLVIVNRCAENTDQTMFRRNIKAVNRGAQIVYETVDGHVLSPQEEQLPFDISGSEITIEDDDFGIWYLDVMDRPEKYDGKKVHFKGIVYRNKRIPSGYFVAGRFAMTCCADDITFIGILSEYAFADELAVRDWIDVTATVHVRYHSLYEGQGPVLVVDEITPSEKPEEDLVYFS